MQTMMKIPGWHKLFTTVLLVIISMILLILPSVNMDTLMNGTQSGKTIFFICLMMGAESILVLRMVLCLNVRSVKISTPDLAMLLWALYMILNSWIKTIPVSLRLLEFYGLILLYIILRQTGKSSFRRLFLALILGGGIQAIYGNLQLWDFYPSHHNLFKMTGSFFNPGPYAGYLAGIFPAALGFYLFKVTPVLPVNDKINIKDKLKRIQTAFLSSILISKIRKSLPGKRQEGPTLRKQDWIGAVTIPVVVFMALVLPASRSRAAWLAVCISTIWLLLFKYPVLDWLRKHLNTPLKQVIVLGMAVVLTGTTLSGLYVYKKGSADGRTLVWKVTLEMIRDYPVAGVGFGQFKAYYMDYQAEYFERDPELEEAMVADNSNYAFNELLQQTAENGIVGLALILVVLIVIFTSSAHRPDNQGTSDRLPDNHDTGYELSVIAKAGIISILVFSLFSYPAQILPIKTSLAFYLAVIAGLAPQKTISLPELSNKRTGQLIAFSSKIMLTLVLLVGIMAGNRFCNRFYHAYQHWQQAFQVYQMGAWKACLEDYEKAYPVLHDNGDFLTNYGKALSMAGEHSKAIEILQQTTNRYPNTVVYTALGDSYKATGETGKAEQAYLHAWHMNPSRFYPKYLLAKLYDETGQREKAVITAKELLEKQIKIESTAIEEIRMEMEKIILKEQNIETRETKNTTGMNTEFKLQKW